MVQCKLCGEEKDDKFFKFENGKIRKRTCYVCVGRRDRSKLKLEMLEALGFSCACCGQDHPMFLTLDHKNGVGKLRETYNEQQLYRLARRQGWPKDEYQTLCISCNFAKGHWGICPHESGVTSAMALEQLRRNVHTYMRTRHDYQASYNGNRWGKLRE